jgi:outer membrane immunogenic protein
MRRRFLPIVIATSLFFAAAAARADGYEPAAKAVALEVSKWTGFYANAGVGYGLWDAETTTVAPGRCVSCVPTDHGGRGWLGEVGVGYDYQVHDRFVAGVLFNYDFSDIDGKTSDVVFATADSSNDQSWFIGARAGWLMTPAILNYWSVGYTQAHFTGSRLHNSFTGQPVVPTAYRQSYEAGGWFLGGGLEVAVHEGWFWRSEARYADYRNEPRREFIRDRFSLNWDPVVGTASSEIVYKFDWRH